MSSPTSTTVFSIVLKDAGLIQVEGAEAAAFLHGQLSSDIANLASDQLRRSGYCTPKGRLLADFLVFMHPGADASSYWLQTDRRLVTALVKRLSMFVLRAKVKLADVSEHYQQIGLWGTDAPTLLRHAGCPVPEQVQRIVHQSGISVAKLEGERFLVIGPHEMLEKLTPLTQPGNIDAWNLADVLAGTARILPETQDLLVPQMINFESVAGVDFKKGCYPGQEIVARSQYRGVIKRRLQLAHTSLDSLGSVSIAPGTELFQVNDPAQPAGMVVLSSASPTEPNRIDLQIECKLDALESGEVHLGSVQGPVLKIDSLPYPLIEI
jgi:folate-binding protein YgfZ